MEVDLQRLEQVLQQYEITIAEANDLVALQGYRVVVVADDSTSMNITDDRDAKSEKKQCMTCDGEGTVNRMQCESCKGRGEAWYVVGDVVTRWMEMKETFQSLIDIVACIIPQGCDVYFLNGPCLKGITAAADPRIVQQFAAGPNGNTPLTETVQKVVREVGNEEMPVLLLILTDGEPDGGSYCFRQFVESVINKQVTQTTFKFQILACTDDHTAVSWLDAFDTEFAAVDVIDDYKSEKKQVLAAGKVAEFRRSDWIIKALLGPVSSKFDAWDESMHTKGEGDVPKCECGDCCVM